MKQVIIVGGGASGMMAALTASASPDTQVTLLERQSRVGRKLLPPGTAGATLPIFTPRRPITTGYIRTLPPPRCSLSAW